MCRATFDRRQGKITFQRGVCWVKENKMKEKLRIFRLLLYKNFLVRKRHWKMGLFVEILIPLLLFLLIQACRDFSANQPQVFENNTYYELKTKGELITKVNYMTIIYFVPENRFTRTLMEKTRSCLKFPNDSKCLIKNTRGGGSVFQKHCSISHDIYIFL